MKKLLPITLILFIAAAPQPLSQNTSRIEHEYQIFLETRPYVHNTLKAILSRLEYIAFFKGNHAFAPATTELTLAKTISEIQTITKACPDMAMKHEIQTYIINPLKEFEHVILEEGNTTNADIAFREILDGYEILALLWKMCSHEFRKYGYKKKLMESLA